LELGAAESCASELTGAFAASRDLRAGARAGEYVVEALIGRGGMGTVYAARQPVIGERVAIKVLAAEMYDASFLARSVDAVRAVNTISHPNIVDIFAFGQLDDGRDYFVMELLEGQSFRERLNAGPLQPRAIDLYLTQLCAALQAAHDAGIVHRDLKPENIWLSRPEHGEPRLKLLDFGIAKFFSKSSANELGLLSDVGVVFGTPSYMSPEQCQGADVDVRTDIYALGVMLYEMYMCELPFVGDALQVLAQHLVTPPPQATRAPERVAQLIATCLAKDPDARPKQACDVLERFQRAKLL
jgi:serine/threonine protein kinase